MICYIIRYVVEDLQKCKNSSKSLQNLWDFDRLDRMIDFYSNHGWRRPLLFSETGN